MMLHRLDDTAIPVDLGQFYDRLAHQAGRLQPLMYRNRAAKQRFDRILELVSMLDRRNSCLELGCSEGMMTTQLAKLFKRVDAVEISQVMLDRCPVIDNVRYYHGDAVTWTPPRKRYDVVIASEIVEHVHDPALLLHKYAGMAGRLLVTCPVTERPNLVGAFDPTLLGKETRQADATGHIWYMDWAGFVKLFDGLRILLLERVGHSGLAVCALDT